MPQMPTGHASFEGPPTLKHVLSFGVAFLFFFLTFVRY